LCCLFGGFVMKMQKKCWSRACITKGISRPHTWTMSSSLLRDFSEASLKLLLFANLENKRDAAQYNG